MSNGDQLRTMPLFGELTEEQLAAVLGVGRRQHVPAGAVILREGDRTDSLYILVGGSVEVTKRLGLATVDRANEPKEKTLVHLTAPQCFGEMGLLEKAERSATITAERECELLEITRADFERLVDADPLLGYRMVCNIAKILAFRLRRTDRDVLNLTIALSLSLGNR
ncbi:MAG: cyclic nucleotide-binding domain-containing protein [Chloroflexi bacterium]|nr:cyclic nucleotide-binding domain-containing protein [Chloroflexota bacterium]